LCRLDPRELGELVADARDRGAVRIELGDRRAADLEQGANVHETFQVQQEVIFPLPSPSDRAVCHN
jgi:DNA-binding transcriptional regulator LsrR (DeoR family)